MVDFPGRQCVKGGDKLAFEDCQLSLSLDGGKKLPSAQWSC